jgi:hypothetical protein
VEILGMPRFHVRVASDKAVAYLAVRLCEVTADGKSWLVSYGLLNLTHRDGHEHPAALAPGRAYDVEIPLNFTAHRFGPGSRARVALSESLWPLVWPAPHPAALSLDLGASRLDLPVRPRPAVEAPMPIALAPPPPSDPSGWPTMEISEVAGETHIIETWPPSSGTIEDIGETASGSGPDVRLSMTPGDPLSCAWSAEQSSRYQRPGWEVAIRAEVSVRSTVGSFHVEERTVATLNGETVADVKHAAAIDRRLC